MQFEVTLTTSARRDIAHYKAQEQRIIATGIAEYLKRVADVESSRRKRLRPNPLAPWELRLGPYRVFYFLEGENVKVVAVGHKVHNRLFIGGEEVSI